MSTEEDDPREQVKQLKLLLKQEEGKRIAVERESAEIKRQAKITEDQAAALKAETENSLAEAAEQMKVALAISQGIWALAHMGRSYLARKIAAARTVHREQQYCLLMGRMIQTFGGKDPTTYQAIVDQANNVIETVKRDGEAIRIQVHEASLSAGLNEFMEVYEKLIEDKVIKYEKVK